MNSLDAKLTNFSSFFFFFFSPRKKRPQLTPK